MDVLNDANSTKTEDTTSDIDVSTLVGENAKYKDVSELAKAYVHADGFIETLKGEKAQTLSELESAKAELEVYQRLATKEVTGNEQLEEDKPKVETPTPQTKETGENSLEDKIRSTLEAERQREKKTENRNAVNQKMIELYGDKAVEVIREKARSLQVGVDWLTNVAETSPTAFFSTLGIQQESSPSGNSNVKGEVNTQALPKFGSGVKPDTYEYFANLRKEKPKAYYSAEVQKQLFNAAKSNPKFYG